MTLLAFPMTNIVNKRIGVESNPGTIFSMERQIAPVTSSNTGVAGIYLVRSNARFRSTTVEYKIWLIIDHLYDL